MKPLALLLAVALGLLLCLTWFRLFSQRERVPMWRHPFAEDWNDPAMDAYDEPVEPWGELCARPSSPLSRLQ
jgi:hypothetical protein